MILNDEAISRLSELVSEEDETSSSYWQENLKAFQYNEGEFAGVSGVEQFTPRKSLLHQVGHRTLLTPFRRMGHRFDRFKEYHRIGDMLTKRRGSQFDLSMMRHVLTLALLDEYLPLKQMRQPIVVIVDGFGTMASLIVTCLPHAKVVLINLTRMLLVDLVYIRKSAPNVDVCVVDDMNGYLTSLASDRLRVIGISADDAGFISEGPIGAAISMVSMQEMDPPVIASYFEAMRRSPNPETFFYCCNRNEKISPDGTVVRFDEYPWSPDDLVMLDEPCPWHQFYYRLKPPFYAKYEGPIRHRLASLRKT